LAPVTTATVSFDHHLHGHNYIHTHTVSLSFNIIIDALCNNKDMYRFM
jgi:hypothetical protein